MINSGDAQARDNLERVLDCLDMDKCETFQDCITWARLRFEDYFVNRVKQLTFTFPEDATTSNEALFWSAPKRSILRAETFGIPIPDWVKSPKKLADAINNMMVPEFEPTTGVKIVTDEKATSTLVASINNAGVINELVRKLENCHNNLPAGFKMNPVQF
ncbi:hypothetical protein ACFE04_025670 [Oxalis oulophora]